MSIQRCGLVVVLFIVLAVIAAAQSSPAAPGSGRVEAYTRERADGSASLLMVLEVANLGKVAEVRVETQDDDEAAGVVLPDGWSVKQDGRKLRLSGPAADSLRFRVDLKGKGATICAKLSEKGIAVEGLNAGRTLFKTRVPVVTLPKVTVLNTLDNALSYPEEFVPGQPMLVTPADEFRNGRWEIHVGDERWVIDEVREFPPNVATLVSPERAPYRVIPTAIGTHVPRIIFTDDWLERLIDAPFPVKPAPATSCQRSLTAGTELAFAGQGACMSGCFPDAASWYGLSIDGKPLLAKSASPTRLTVWVPHDMPPGPHTIQWNGDSGGTGQVTLGVLQLDGAIDRNLLWKGQSTTMRLRVLGTDKPLPLIVLNKTPGVIRVEGGDTQSVQTSGGVDNAVTRNVQGIRRGDFKIEYSLSQPGCGLP